MLPMGECSPKFEQAFKSIKKGVKRPFNAGLRYFAIECQVNAKQKKSAVANCATPKPPNAQ